MPFDAFKLLIRLNNLKNAIAAKGSPRAAKLPLPADFAGLFTRS
jgi:hypothetical protein